MKLSTAKRALTLLGLCGIAIAVIALSGGDPGASRAVERPPLPSGLVPSPTWGSAPPGLQAPPSSHPNIVFILTDDLSFDLLRFMPHVQEMERRGLTFNNYFVSDSLCCPSRSSIFTGNFPHDTHVFSNFGRDGGFHAFHARGEERHTFAVALQRAGYDTALMGKYLNGYMGAGHGVATDGSASRAVAANYVPPGWTDWSVAGWGYPEFNYTLNENGALDTYGAQPSDYMTNVLADRGVDFIDRSAGSGRPFFLELATFAPHSPYVPDPRDANDFPGLTAPRPPSFDTLPTRAPRWLRGRQPLTAAHVARIDKVFRLRAQAVQAVDRMIGRVEAALAANGIGRDTYLVFSSDNGLHTGEYRLMPGKLTAFDTDIHVPLVVVGPGVRAGARTGAIAENVDLAKTFTGIAGTSLAGDGHSLLPLIQGGTPADWRTAALVEHHGPRISRLDPDFQQPASGAPWTYEAMRTRGFLYVEYNDGEREFYDLVRDPFELHNIAYALTPQQRHELHSELKAMRHCHGGKTCWAAMHVAAIPGL
jgi:N-acetylglucosamine-6-sulfatase